MTKTQPQFRGLIGKDPAIHADDQSLMGVVLPQSEFPNFDHGARRSAPIIKPLVQSSAVLGPVNALYSATHTFRYFASIPGSTQKLRLRGR